MSQPALSARSHLGPRSATVAALIDVIAVCVFVLIGRRSHHESSALAGFLGTVWPFLAGLLVGWLVSRAWTRPQQLWPAGVIVWIVSVVVGLGLRGLTGGGLAWTFVLVTTVVLAVLLIGWRALVAVLRAAGRSSE